MTPPTGPIKTRAPWRGGQFGCTWNDARPFLPAFQQAHAKYPRITVALGASVTAIESCYTVALIAQPDGYGGGTAKGPMQVKDELWQWLEPDADVLTLEGGVLLGFAVLDYYWRQTGTWQGAIKKYHPGVNHANGTTPDSYVESVGGMLAEWRAADRPATPDQPEPGVYDFTDPGWPAQVEYGIVEKPGEGAGFDRVPFRGPDMLGTCDHITAGDGTPDFIRRFFSTGGERAWDALTDAVIGRDGSALILNDPWDPDNGGTRAGWANGGSNGLEGDGIAFVRTLGASAINRRLFSKEHIARVGERLTDKQVETSIAMSVVAHQRAKTKWDQFPHNDLAGCVTAMVHFEFATKGCPEDVFMAEHLPVIWQGTAQGLKELQTGSREPVEPVPLPPPLTPKPDPTDLPFGLPWTAVEWMFGTLERTMPDGTTRLYPADPEGIITNTWLERAARDGVFPRAVSWEAHGDKQFVQFQNGWVLYTPKLDDFVNWRWVDIRDLEAERKVAA